LTADQETIAVETELIAFLSAGASYGFPDGVVQRLETHGSKIFLVGDRAYKLKRPIAFSALDYRNVERREAACRAEVALNRRTAPDLYFGTHAIRRRANGSLGFDGEGKLLDWVVEMWRFDQADLWDRLADAGLLHGRLMQGLADEIARFHDVAEPIMAVGGAVGLSQAIAQNETDFATVGGVLDRGMVRTVQARSVAALREVGSLLDRRAGEGKVRRCHGDLRLANICLINGRPTLFDAIEFSDAISIIDVLYDFSFLLMDLCGRRLFRFANIAFNRYLDRTSEGDGLAALPLMLSIRAATRAYGLACGVQRRLARPDEARAFAASAGRHLTLAAELLEKSPPRLVALGGLGSGAKTALDHGLAVCVATMPGARVLRADVAERRCLGLAPDARIPAARRGAALAADVQAALLQDTADAIAAGWSVILDAPLMRPQDRAAIQSFAAIQHIPFFGLWLGPARELHEGERQGWRAVQLDGDFAALLAHTRALIDFSARHATAQPGFRA
jgi:aminoglycoside phosphotransferase family enzyme/predicted kinase